MGDIIITVRHETPAFECNFRPQTNRWIAHANRLGNINDKPVVYRMNFYGLTDNLKRMVSWSLKEDKKVRVIVISNNKIIYWKDGRKFYINGFPVLKTTILNCMNILFTHARRCKSQEEFEANMERYLNIDPVVRKAITDKVLYRFYKLDGEKVETLLNIQVIGKKEVAIEMNPGLWVPMSVGAFKSFVNCGNRKNKFTNISPEELVHFTTGKLLSEGDIKMTHAFLEQNRKSALREKRSLELIEDLSTRFKGIYGMDIDDVENGGRVMTAQAVKEKNTVMFVKGKQLDWAVVTRALKATGRQDVSTYFVVPVTKETISFGREKDGLQNLYIEMGKRVSLGYLTDGKFSPRGSYMVGQRDGKQQLFYCEGPICIDNAQNDVSIGDQLAGRALALLNDVHSFNNVSTLRTYQQYKYGMQKNEVNLMACLMCGSLTKRSSIGNLTCSKCGLIQVSRIPLLGGGIGSADRKLVEMNLLCAELGLQDAEEAKKIMRSAYVQISRGNYTNEELAVVSLYIYLRMNNRVANLKKMCDIMGVQVGRAKRVLARTEDYFNIDLNIILKRPAPFVK